MRKGNIYREYRLKSYLNMNHYIIFNGKPGQVHPHTWEFVTVIIMPGDEFVEFSVFEKAVDRFLSTYQNRIMNEVAPFDVTMPTVENVTDYFAGELDTIISDLGGCLISLEGSETPTRGYIVSLGQQQNVVDRIDEIKEKYVDNMVERVVSDIKKKLE